MSWLRELRGKEIEKVFRDGEFIVREGERTREMYVIQSGKVAITKNVEGQEIQLATLGRGDFFGEMSLLESMARDANARAVGETKLLVIAAGGLLLRLRRDPTFAFEMLHRLSGRIRTLNAKVVQFTKDTHSREETSPKVEVLLYSDERDVHLEEESSSVDLRSSQGN